MNKKKILALCLIVCLLAGCAAKEQTAEKIPADRTPAETVALVKDEFREIEEYWEIDKYVAQNKKEKTNSA